MRQLLARLCLAVALALAGPGAYAHALTHVGEALEDLHHQHHGDAGPGHHDHHHDDDAGDGHQERYGCALDAAFAGSDALGARAEVAVQPPAAAAAPSFQRASRTLPCEALARFASRAPPLSR